LGNDSLIVKLSDELVDEVKLDFVVVEQNGEGD
jgi:hypothetical protein